MFWKVHDACVIKMRNASAHVCVNILLSVWLLKYILYTDCLCTCIVVLYLCKLIIELNWIWFFFFSQLTIAKVHSEKRIHALGGKDYKSYETTEDSEETGTPVSKVWMSSECINYTPIHFTLICNCFKVTKLEPIFWNQF